ncbi:hypothetical protein WMY93_031494 [Mugilogobius chulae]|uniref:Uncharacterized protein n=1 Tax=Mugilogobius chulae TaxID=88201 RepID=A0AAW0MM76_9GOBI
MDGKKEREGRERDGERERMREKETGENNSHMTHKCKLEGQNFFFPFARPRDGKRQATGAGRRLSGFCRTLDTKQQLLRCNGTGVRTGLHGKKVMCESNAEGHNDYCKAKK